MLISLEQALESVLSCVRPLPARRAPLAEALGCCLAHDVRSDRDQPPADRSAMDGYAVIASDLVRARRRLRLIGEAAAGRRTRLRLRPGTCAAILTGGNVPPGADAVVPVEQTRQEGHEVIFLSSARRGDNIRRRGEEARRGSVVLPKGSTLTPARIGACAMVGKAVVDVCPRPKVAVIVTGTEVRDVGDRVSAHELRDSNGPCLVAALRERGFHAAGRIVVPDDPEAIAARLDGVLRGCDVAILTGGVSVGRYDFVPEAIRRVGARLRFHGVKMRPGRPQLYATRPKNRHIFALPGNPVSALTGFHELVLPGLRRLCGVRKEQCRPVMRLRLARPIRSAGDRTCLALAQVVQTASGPEALPIRSRGSADLLAACAADGVIAVPEGIRTVPAGSVVEFHTWREPT